MTFLYPYALFALLAIPVLIIIYILKNKYKEETAPSTYIWDLSEKFLKKRNPLHRFEHLLSLIVQILTIAGLSIALAHPQIVLKGQTDNIVFVLDGSASMKMKARQYGEDGKPLTEVVDKEEVPVYSEKTRFEMAKDQIIQMVDSADSGSSFSLIYAAEETRAVCTNIANHETFKSFLDTVSVTNASSNLDEAMSEAQKLFSDGKASACYVATDRYHGTGKDAEAEKAATDANAESLKAGNVGLIDVGSSEVNYAVLGLTYSYGKGTFTDDQAEHDYIQLEPKLISYDSDAEVSVVFYYTHLNEKGEEVTEAIANEVHKYKLEAGILNQNPVYVKNDDGKYSSVLSVSATITDKDAIADDNTFVLYDRPSTLGTSTTTGSVSTKTNILLVSDSPRYLKSAFNALGSSANKPNNVTVRSTSAYSPDKDTENYQIYVFENYTPSRLPTSGAIWLINTDKTVDNSGFTVLERKDSTGGFELKYTDNQTDEYKQYTNGCAFNDIQVKQYYKYDTSAVTPTCDFTTILATEDNIPMIFAGKNQNGQREVVFSFALQDSNLPMKYDFLALVYNFLNYSNPDLVGKFNYNVGDALTLTVPDTVTSVNVKTPEGEQDALDTDEVKAMSYELTEVGTYELTLVSTDATQNNQTVKLFVMYPQAEGSSTTAKDDQEIYSLSVANVVKADGIFDNILPIVIAASVLFVLDWGLYIHEQY